jgi:hypothetical protein
VHNIIAHDIFIHHCDVGNRGIARCGRNLKSQGDFLTTPSPVYPRAFRLCDEQMMKGNIGAIGNALAQAPKCGEAGSHPLFCVNDPTGFGDHLKPLNP